MGPALGLALGLLAPAVLFSRPSEAALAVLLLLALALLAARAGRMRAAEGVLAAAGVALGAHAALPWVLPPGERALVRLAREEPRPALVVGRIASFVTAIPGHGSFDLAVESACLRGACAARTGITRVSVEGLPQDGVPILPWRKGDRVEVTGILRLPRDFAVPGVASRVTALGREGVETLLVAKSTALVRTLEAAPPGPVLRCREAILESIRTHVANGRRPSRDPDAGAGFEVVDDTRAAAVLGAMLVDDRALLDEESTRALAEAGMIDALSISGLHVAIVGGAFYALAGLLRLGGRAAASLSLAAVIAYVAVAGAPAPAVRSAIVTAVVLLGTAIHRESPGGNTLALAFLVGGVAEPRGLLGPGFQLTYAAAAGLLLVAPPIAAVLRGFLPRRLALALAASLAAEAAVAPLSLHHFARLSLAGPVLNLAGVPLAGVAVLAGLGLPLWGALHPALGRLVGAIASLAVDGLFAVAGPHIPVSIRLVPASLPLVLVALLALAFAVLGRARLRVRIAVVVLAYGALLAVPPLVAGRREDGAALHVDVLDVGQGDALLVELAGGGTVLVDAGGLLRSRFDVGERVVVPFLLSRGHRTIDLAIVTHAHPDHAAGMRAVLRELRVRELWLGDDPAADPIAAELRREAAARGTRVVDARRGRTLVLGDARLTVLSPPPGSSPPAEVENSRSIVVRLATSQGALLLTGDIHADAERVVARRAGRAMRRSRWRTTGAGRRPIPSSWRRWLRVWRCSRAALPTASATPTPRCSRLSPGLVVRCWRTDLQGTISVSVDRERHLSVGWERDRRFRPAP